MKILKIKTERMPHRLIAVSIKAYLHEYMTLYCLAKGVTKTKIIMGFLDVWLRETRERESDDMLMQELADRISDRYHSDDNYAGIPFEEFRMMMDKELERNGLKLSYISTVMNRVRK